MIQQLVMHEDHLDDVEAVILNMLTLDRTSMSASDTTIPSALAALTMLVRKNCVLRERFFKSGDTTNTLLEILECKNANVARITSACILSFEEHHRLVTSLYKPNVITDKKGEQVTEISGWDVDTIRQSLRAISALVKDSTVSSIGFDSAILEVICTDRRMLVLTNKIKATIEKKINKSMDYPNSRLCFPEALLEEWVFDLLCMRSDLLTQMATAVTNGGGDPWKNFKPKHEEFASFISREFEVANTDATIPPEAHAEWFQEVVTLVTTVQEKLKKDEEISDVCSILMDGDTDGPSSRVGIVVPILTLLHKCRILQEHNLISELEVEGISDIEKEACYVIGLLASKQGIQDRIASSFLIEGKNGIEQLIPLLQRYQPSAKNAANASVARRASDAITNLAHENSRIKTMVRNANGIPPLVNLLESQEKKVQKAAASALRTLAFKNGENKNQIVECGALPKLIFMARSEDVMIHKEAIGVIGNLVHSSPHIKRRALDEGALQPVIELLKSQCSETQREAALLLGQFAARLEPAAPGDPDYRTKIVQRGAVEPLIKMLGGQFVYREPGLREMAAFALGRLAQHGDNQVGICHSDGLRPLLTLLESEIEDIAEGLRHHSASGKSDHEIDLDAKRFAENLQHNAAFALYGLAAHQDNVPKMLKENAFMRLKFSHLIAEQSKQCVNKTLKRLEDGVSRRDVLTYLGFVISTGKPVERQRVTLALAWLIRKENQDYLKDMRAVFIDKGGLDVLSGALLDTPAEPIDFSGHTSGLAGGKRIVNVIMEALREIKDKLVSQVVVESHMMPPPSTPTAEEHMPANFNDPELSDVTFIARDDEGEKREFNAHRIAFTHASDAFLSTLEAGKADVDVYPATYKVDLEDVCWNVLEAMMDFIYTGTVGPMSSLRDQAFLQHRCEDVLSATTRFDLPGLKYLTEKLFIDNVKMDTFTFARTCALYRAAVEHDAVAIQDHVLGYVLDNYDKPWIDDDVTMNCLTSYKARVKDIVECFGKGLVKYLDKLLRRERVAVVADAQDE
jgi:HEAT repeat protein